MKLIADSDAGLHQGAGTGNGYAAAAGGHKQAVAPHKGHGIFAAHYFYATYYPTLFPIEMAFLVSLIGAPVLSIIARRMLNQRRRSGIFMMIGVYTGLLIWSLALPLFTFLATGIISPIIPIWIAYNVVFAALAVTVVILLLKNKRIKY